MSETAVPESRTYRHIKCDGETTVGGQPFEVVSNPMSSMEQTQCSTCQAMFPIAEFQWVDSGETIADYYARHTQNATDKQRFLCSKKFMVSVILASAIVVATLLFVFIPGNMVAKLAGLVGGFLVGAMIGMAIFITGFANPIKKKVCGVSDTRSLI